MSTAASQHYVRRPDALYIAGQWVKPHGSSTIDVIDSATEETFLTVAAAEVEDVNKAVAAAREAFDHGPWRRTSPQERAAVVRAIADAWEKRADALADGWTRESGVLRSISGGAWKDVSSALRTYADMAATYPWETRHTSNGFPALLTREPVGVVAAIIPWNYPSFLIAHKAGAALLAGCTMVIKASPEAPSSAYMFAEICEEIGLPAGVVNVLTADREVSEALVRHPAVDKVSFTGSSATGRRIAGICADRIARTTLELGGKSPALVLDDYDLGKAATAIAGSTPMITGQVCAALTRVIVSEHRHDDLVDALADRFRQIRTGDPFDPATQMGPLATAAQRDRVEGYIRKGQADGYRIATGGQRPAHLNRGYFIEPTVFAGVDPDAVIAQEEIFGPVVSVIPVKDEEDAIRVANRSIFGLNSSVFTDDVDRAYAVARRLDAGTVGHNDYRIDFDIAFGGFKQSGIGREGGADGLAAYLEAKTIIMERMPAAVR